MLYGDHPHPAPDKFYLLFVPHKHNLEAEYARIPQLNAANDLALTFVQRSWEDNGTSVLLESLADLPKSKKRVALGTLLASDHTNKVLFRNGKVMHVEDA